MSVTTILVVAWFVVIVFWLANYYHRENYRYELEYRAGKRPRWDKPDDYDD